MDVSHRRTFSSVVVVWLGTAWVSAFACFGGDNAADGGGGDAPSDGTADACNSPFGCSDSSITADPCADDGATIPSDASLGNRVRAVFDVTCSGGPERGCHSEFAANTTLQVIDSGPYGIIDVPSSEMPDVLRVEPYNPDQSYLYWKVSGDPRRAPGSGVMPLVSSADWDSGSVNACVAQLMHDWIEAGAP